MQDSRDITIDPLIGMNHLIGGRWKLLIMRELTEGPRRFGDLRRSLGDISQKVLTDALRTMEEAGLVTRVVYPEITLHVEYSLSALGYEMTVLLRTMASCYAKYTIFSNNFANAAACPSENNAYYQVPKFKKDIESQDYTQRIDFARRLIREADYIIVGTGSGINVASDMNLFDKKLAKRLFPEYYMQGLTCIDDMINAYAQISPENELAYWKFWAEYLWEFRYCRPVSQAHTDLACILMGKSYFAVSSNADGQLEKSSLDSSRIYLPLGSYSFLQCAFPCEDNVYDALPYVERILADLDSGISIHPESIPHCPICGDYLVPNHFRCRNISLVSSSRLAQRRSFMDFLHYTMNKTVVFLEIGSGFRLQNIIRHPFEEYSSINPNAALIRINSKFPQINHQGWAGTALSFGENEAQVLHDFVS